MVCMTLTFVVAVVFMQAFTTMPLYLRDAYRLEELGIGLLLAVNPVLILAFEMLLVRRLERRPPLPIISLGVLLYGVGFALLPAGATFAWAVLAIAVWTAGEMLESPMLCSFVAKRTEPASRGRYMGLFMATYSAAALVAPIVGTQI